VCDVVSLDLPLRSSSNTLSLSSKWCCQCPTVFLVHPSCSAASCCVSPIRVRATAAERSIGERGRWEPSWRSNRGGEEGGGSGDERGEEGGAGMWGPLQHSHRWSRCVWWEWDSQLLHMEHRSLLLWCERQAGVEEEWRGEGEEGVVLNGEAATIAGIAAGVRGWTTDEDGLQ